MSDDTELRKIALEKAAEICGFNDPHFVLDAAHEFYSFLIGNVSLPRTNLGGLGNAQNHGGQYMKANS